MKIATYNVNSINARLPVLLSWLESSRPDVACLQELKAADEKFPIDAIREAGYEAVWHGQKAWNGVAILSRGDMPQETRKGFADRHGFWGGLAYARRRSFGADSELLEFQRLDSAEGFETRELRPMHARSVFDLVARPERLVFQVQQDPHPKIRDGQGFPGDPDDTQSRYIEAVVGGLTVGCLCLPNGNPAPGPKFDYKLKWFERFSDHAAGLLKKGGPVVLAGDYNVIPTELDAYKPERWVDDALFMPETREAYRQLLAQGWTDALRHLHPDEVIYTFFDYMRGAFTRNAGLRIDHLLLSPELAPRLKAAGVDRGIRAMEKTSDHAPTWIEVDWDL